MDQMMYQILAQVHYMPDAWKQHANSFEVRDEFVKLFQFKFVYLLEELLSPLITPLMLLLWLRPRSVKVVDFLRNFTVDVVGVGDVCSFAQMDTRRHGNVRWLSKTNAKKSFQARNGKTELSLIHFVHTNPNWKAPLDALAFIDELRDQALKESVTVNNIYGDHMINSVLPDISNKNTHSYQYQDKEAAGSSSQTAAASSGADMRKTHETSSYLNNNSTKSVHLNQSSSLNKSLYHLQSLYSPQLQKPDSYFAPNTLPDVQIQTQQSFGTMPRGAVSRIEGPLFTTKQEKQTLMSIAQASTLQLSTNSMFPMSAQSMHTTALENSLDMCFSALYMHELHRKYNHGDYIDLDKVKEENDDENEQKPDASDYYLSQKRPLLGKSVIKFRPNNYDEESEATDNEQIETLVNHSEDNPVFNNNNNNNNNRLEMKPNSKI
jgi:hypothetical protein